MSRLKNVLGLAVLLSVTAVLRADEFRVNRLFSDRMVLQRDHPVRIFGTGAGDAVVTVSLGGARAPAARVGEEWMATLPALPAGGPYTLTIDGPRRIRFSDVWLGDVWVCGGQSNMRQELREIPEFVANPTVWARAEVRLLRSAYQRNPAPARDLVPAAGYEAGWQIATADTLREFSAAGFHFGAVLQRELNVRIGLIDVSVGATPIEVWMDADLLRRISPRTLSAKVSRPNRTPTYYYNGMIAPLQRFPIKGVVWYQGEANAPNAPEYANLFTGLIRRWREQWGQGDFPFYWVQLASFGGRPEHPWPWLREAQGHALAEPNTGMAIAIDLGDFADIHPRRKREVGERLAALALRAEGRPVVAAGPRFARAEFRTGEAIVHFDATAGGLETRAVVMNRNLGFAPGADPDASRIPADEPAGFALAGVDKKFFPARARIERDTVIVSCPNVPAPVAVRYAWENFALANLYNRAGLPAEPFRTDTFAFENRATP